MEDRHVEKMGKNEYVIGRNYNFNSIKEQIAKFHRKGQKKKLSKRYDLKEMNKKASG
nr:hypothetical protein [uncultured Draconibacterium sp.]